MIKKLDDYTFSIKTAGLGERMQFEPNTFCGDIQHGIGLGIAEVRGGWVIPLGEAWKMVLISTLIAIGTTIKNNVQKIIKRSYA